MRIEKAIGHLRDEYTLFGESGVIYRATYPDYHYVWHPLKGLCVRMFPESMQYTADIGRSDWVNNDWVFRPHNGEPERK